jgi:hypothetical protein
MKQGIWSMVAVVGMLAVGCGSNSGTQAASTTSSAKSTAKSTATSAANSRARAEAADEANSGQMTVVYEDADTPEAIQGKELMQETGLLESLSQEINDWLELPYDIPVIGSQCGVANDFWDPDENEIFLCYEDVDNSLQLFGDDPDPAAAARRIAVGAFYHELGHMAIDIYDLPVTGREEDVADQLAAYWLLAPVDGEVNADYVQAAKDTADYYDLDSAAPEDLDETSFADEHTLDQSRAYNFHCWIYGSDPQANADIVSSGQLPEERAGQCEDEYDQLARAWDALLEPHYK